MLIEVCSFNRDIFAEKDFSFISFFKTLFLIDLNIQHPIRLINLNRNKSLMEVITEYIDDLN